jgi:hypothetical protein
MKSVLSHRSRWPQQPLDEQDWIKDTKEALNFGNHKGAVQLHDLLKKLVTDNIVQCLALPLPLDTIASILEFSLLPSTSKRRTPSTNVVRSPQKTN